MIVMILDYLKAWWVTQTTKKASEVSLSGIVDDAVVPQIVVEVLEMAPDCSLRGVVKFPDGDSFRCLIAGGCLHVLDGKIHAQPISFVRSPCDSVSFLFAFHKGKPKAQEIVVGSSYGVNNGRTVMYGGAKLKEKFIEKCDQLAGVPVVIVNSTKEGEVSGYSSIKNPVGSSYFRGCRRGSV